MNLFDQKVTQLYGDGKPVLLIADGAACHKADTIKNEQIHLVHLPTACLELNPAERFFKELCAPMSNRVFGTIEQVEDYLCRILKKYYDDPKLVIALA